MMLPQTEADKIMIKVEDDPPRRAFLRKCSWLAAALAAGSVSSPSLALAAGPKQSVVVRDSQTGRPVVGATVAVTDGLASFVPQVTDKNGRATFTTRAGIRTIQIFHRSYYSYINAVNQSQASYGIALPPLPRTVRNNWWATANVPSADPLRLLNSVGLVNKLGRASLDDVAGILQGLNIGAAGTCLVLGATTAGVGAAPCAILAVASLGLDAAEFVNWVAHKIGLRAVQAIDFYFLPLPTPTLLMVPVLG